MTARRRAGFTLLEILIVVLIIGITAALVIPESIEAVRGSRLRSGLEQIISLNRYARAKALLDTRPMAILYHGDTGRIQLLQLPPRQDITLDLGEMTPTPRMEPGGDEWVADTSGLTELERVSLPDGITIQNVRGGRREEETWFVVYTAGGMTDPHTVEVRDSGDQMTYITVEGLTGEVRIHE